MAVDIMFSFKFLIVYLKKKKKIEELENVLRFINCI